MGKTLRELKEELAQLEIAIRLARDREGQKSRRSRKEGPGPTRQIATAIWSDRVPASLRRRVRHALAKLPGPGGWEAPDYRERVFAAIRNVAKAWGGKCVSVAYDGHKQPIEFECADGHRFPMLIHMVRNGSWCQACAYERATIHSLEEARALAAQRGSQCLSTRYDKLRSKLQWRCAAGHEWSASLEGALKGDWCRVCHFTRIKPQQEIIERTAAERGGRCLSAYIDKETALEWQCAEGHTWSAPWFRVSKGQWCHRCAVKARTRTIDDLRQVAQSRGGRCLSTSYLGVHEKHEWECMDRHVWHATANSIWRGSWCPECAWESRRMARNRRKDKGQAPILV
jgi:hypothetical protein